MGRLKEEAVAFNFLKGARPAAAAQLLFIRQPVIRVELQTQLQSQHGHWLHTSTTGTSMTQLHINVNVESHVW